MSTKCARQRDSNLFEKSNICEEIRLRAHLVHNFGIIFHILKNMEQPKQSYI